MKATIEKVGDKIVVKLPDQTAAHLGLNEGDRLLARVEDGALVVTALPSGTVLGRVPDEEIREIALRAARKRLGDAVEDVDAMAGADTSEEPAWFISFLVERDRMGTGTDSIRIGQQIRDELCRRGDEAYPYISFLERKDWHRREGARISGR